MQNDEQAIRQLVATWMAATKAGDMETVLSLMADDVVFLLPGRPPMIESRRSPRRRKRNRNKDRFSSTAQVRFKRSRS